MTTTTLSLDHPVLPAVRTIGDRYAVTGLEATAIDHLVAERLATWTVCLWLCSRPAKPAPRFMWHRSLGWIPEPDPE